MVLFKVLTSGLHLNQLPVQSHVSLCTPMIKLFLQSPSILQLQMYATFNFLLSGNKFCWLLIGVSFLQFLATASTDKMVNAVLFPLDSEVT